ncbi:MAG: hypothetical protein JWN04_2928 [Myxococcaceae bacterium]|nr:hypothetical protein [Myxococcaceae bacterium]
MSTYVQHECIGGIGQSLQRSERVDSILREGR